MFDEAPTAQNALMQDAAFAQALRLCGGEPVHLPGGLMVLRRRILGVPLAMLPRAAPPLDLNDQLRAAGLHRIPLILSPDRPCPLPRSLRLRNPVTLAVVDLTAPHHARRARLHQKWRNQLRRAENTEMTITRAPLPPDPATCVLRLEDRQSRLRGYANWPAPLTAAFASVAPDQTNLFRAAYQGRRLGHMLFLSHGDHVSYHLGHSNAEGRQLGAHNLLLWRAMDHFAKAGFTVLELGVLSEKTPGLNRFKLRAGAQRITTGGTHLCFRPLAKG